MGSLLSKSRQTVGQSHQFKDDDLAYIYNRAKTGDALSIGECLNELLPHKDKIPFSCLLFESAVREGDLLSPFVIAAKNGYVKVLQFFIERFGDMLDLNHVGFIREFEAGKQYLWLSVLGREGTPSELCVHEQTALCTACLSGEVKIVQLLLNSGADPNVANCHGATPLHETAINGNIEIAELLIKKGSIIDSTNHRGATPLCCAIACDNPEVVKLLLQQGANLHHTLKDGFTPFHITASLNITPGELSKITKHKMDTSAFFTSKETLTGTRCKIPCPLYIMAATVFLKCQNQNPIMDVPMINKHQSSENVMSLFSDKNCTLRQQVDVLLILVSVEFLHRVLFNTPPYEVSTEYLIQWRSALELKEVSRLNWFEESQSCCYGDRIEFQCPSDIDKIQNLGQECWLEELTFQSIMVLQRCLGSDSCALYYYLFRSIFALTLARSPTLASVILIRAVELSGWDTRSDDEFFAIFGEICYSRRWIHMFRSCVEELSTAGYNLVKVLGFSLRVLEMHSLHPICYTKFPLPDLRDLAKIFLLKLELGLDASLGPKVSTQVCSLCSCLHRSVGIACKEGMELQDGLHTLLRKLTDLNLKFQNEFNIIQMIVQQLYTQSNKINFTSVNLLEIVLDWGAHVLLHQSRKEQADMPLHVAIATHQSVLDSHPGMESQQAKAIQTLLSYGGHLDIKDKKGLTVMDLADKRQKEGILAPFLPLSLSCLACQAVVSLNIPFQSYYDVPPRICKQIELHI